MKSILVALLPIFLIIVGCSTESLTGAQDDASSRVAVEDQTAFVAVDELATKNGVHMVPHKGIATGAPFEQRPHPDCPGETVIRSLGEGTGHGTQIGKFTWTNSHCFDFTTLEFYDGQLTYVAANGDEVYIEYYGELTGPSSWIEYETVLGGTGRFENATGWAVGFGESTDTPDGSHWVIEYDGKISSVGSAK